MAVVDPSTIVPELDSFCLLCRRTASVGESELVAADGRMANYQDLFAHVMVYPAPAMGNANTERPWIRFNEESGAVYEASHRGDLIVADSPASTESPTIEHVRDATRLHLLPSISNFLLGSADVFSAWMHIICLDSDEQYRIETHWDVGEGVFGGTNKHPRHGEMIGHYIGSVAGRRIKSVTLSFDEIGRLGSGSSISVYGKRSPLLDADWNYELDRSATTSGVWRPTDKALFRRVMKVTNLPAPGFSNTRPLPDTSFAMATMRISEAWVVDESQGISEDPGDQLGFKIDATTLQVSSPSGGRDFSGYDYAYVVLNWTRA